MYTSYRVIREPVQSSHIPVRVTERRTGARRARGRTATNKGILSTSHTLLNQSIWITLKTRTPSIPMATACIQRRRPPLRLTCPNLRRPLRMHPELCPLPPPRQALVLPFRRQAHIACHPSTRPNSVVFVTSGCIQETTRRSWYACLSHTAPTRLLTDCSLPKITDAQKTSVNSTSPYITYIIQSGVRGSSSPVAPLSHNLTERRGLSQVLGVRVSTL